MDPTVKHIWQKLLYPAVATIVVGYIAYVVATGWKPGGAGSEAISPVEGPEGSALTMTVPKDVNLPSQITATFHDSGEHGFIAVKSGGGMYMTYDPTTNLDYTSPVQVGSDGKVSIMVPDGICGYVVKSDLEPNPLPKKVTVTLSGPDGQPISGAPTATFGVTCDTYTLSVKTKASKDPVLPDGVDQSIVTATLTVTGPAQFVNSERVKAGASKITLTTPLGLVFVEFTTDLGVLAPNPSKLKTDLAGEASVTITSPDAGIASVRASALAVGDAKEQIHFKPKITAVKMDFIQPISPTNYELQTIPKNAKDLDFTWKFEYPAGGMCGHMTGPLTGKNLLKNGYFHGPANGYPEGCPEDKEMASKVTVTATDKDGQTDTKTFGARAFEGQGFVPLK